MAKKYDASDIEVLELDRDRVQSQPQLYIPDKKLAGAIHLVREIKDNSDDEAMLLGASSTTIEVSFDEVTREVIIKDNCRGIPHEKLRELCEVLHSSAKLKKGDNSAYKFAGGMHGVGMKLANFLSEYFIVKSTRDGKSVTRYYEDGLFTKDKSESVSDKEHGTTVTFKISEKYLKDVDKMKCKHIQKMIEEKADACPGLVTKFIGITKEGKKIKEKYVGLNTNELLTKYSTPTSKVWEMEDKNKDDSIRVRLAFGYDSKETDGCNLRGWTNFIYNKEGGTHIDGFVDGLHDFFKKYMNNNFFSDKDKKNLQIKKEDIKLGLSGVIVLLMTSPEFKGQTKEELKSDEILGHMNQLVKNRLSKLPDSDLRAISTIIRDNIKARMSSQRARQQVKKVGNGLSRDSIAKYTTAKMGCPVDYRELYLVEGLSAATQTEKARFDFQEIYQLRGKVDNIFDKPTSVYSKIEIVEDMSRIIGLVPGKRGGTINHDRILGFTDADPDGLAIRAGLVLIFAVAFPQVIEEGKLYMVEPPLYSFVDSGKKMFVSTNREYLTYLQDKFSRENTLYRNGSKLTGSNLIEFLIRNERYMEYLNKLANKNACSDYLMELIMANIRSIGTDKSKVEKWDKLIKKKFSKQLGAKWNDDCIVISGIKDSVYEMVELDDDLLTSSKSVRFLNLIDANMGNTYGYSIKGIHDYEDIGIYEVLTIFNNYKGKELHRYKGLGEMPTDALRNTCLDLSRQRSVKITFKDIDKSLRELAWLHSSKEAHRNTRKEFMKAYIPDIQEIST